VPPEGVPLVAPQPGSAVAEKPDRPTRDPWYCAYPFLVAQVNPGGRVHACCANWVREDPGCYGRITERPLREVWNNQRAREFRRSIVDGSYRNCKLDDCALYRDPGSDIRSYAGGRYGAVLERFLRNEEAPIEPVDFFLQYDTTCNLSCPSCRCGVHVARGEELAAAAAVQSHLFDGSGTPRKITLCGTGEALASPVLRSLLVDYATLGLEGCHLALLTNGTLLDEPTYRRLSAAPWIEEINVSIDAARPETFELVRRGASHGTLKRNLGFYSRLLASGRIRVFAASFTLQARNFRELYEFFDLCDELGVTAIRVNTLAPCGELERPDAYRAHAVHLPAHPDFPELCEVLGAGRFENQPTAYYSGALAAIHRDPEAYARRWLARHAAGLDAAGASDGGARAVRSPVETAIERSGGAARRGAPCACDGGDSPAAP
jgi:MoaA/NifB/PqqE/SkfB family radical SAM enzyme